MALVVLRTKYYYMMFWSVSIFEQPFEEHKPYRPESPTILRHRARHARRSTLRHYYPKGTFVAVRRGRSAGYLRSKVDFETFSFFGFGDALLIKAQIRITRFPNFCISYWKHKSYFVVIFRVRTHDMYCTLRQSPIFAIFSVVLFRHLSRIFP